MLDNNCLLMSHYIGGESLKTLLDTVHLQPLHTFFLNLLCTRVNISIVSVYTLNIVVILGLNYTLLYHVHIFFLFKFHNNL